MFGHSGRVSCGGTFDILFNLSLTSFVADYANVTLLAMADLNFRGMAKCDCFP